MPSPVVCMMLKAPVPGRVKTRLARDIGDASAALLYRALVEYQVQNLPEFLPVTVAFDPPDAEQSMRGWLGERPRYIPQAPGDLGARLKHAAICCFDEGASGVLFIGGDCPGLDRARITGAASAMEAEDVVVLPAVDGGYCLIGISSMRGLGVFDAISWSTSHVFEETVARCRDLGLRWCVLEPALEDVDDLESLTRAREYLAALPFEDLIQ